MVSIGQKAQVLARRGMDILAENHPSKRRHPVRRWPRWQMLRPAPNVEACTRLHLNCGPSHDEGILNAPVVAEQPEQLVGPHFRDLRLVSKYQRSLLTCPVAISTVSLLHHSPLPRQGESGLFPDIFSQSAINPNPPPLNYTRYPPGSPPEAPRVPSQLIHQLPVRLILSSPASVLSRAKRCCIAAKTMARLGPWPCLSQWTLGG